MPTSSSTIVNINDIIRKFRTEGRCIKFSKETITYMAGILGYKMKHFGAACGYDKSIITAIYRHIMKAVEYEKKVREWKASQPPKKRAVRKKPTAPVQKPVQQPMSEPLDNYFAYNGEPDRLDYEFELESVDMPSDDRIDEAIKNEINSIIV